MDRKKELEALRERMKAVVIETCNRIGCKECGLKWEGSCSALILESQIMDIEFEEFANGVD